MAWSRPFIARLTLALGLVFVAAAVGAAAPVRPAEAADGADAGERIYRSGSTAPGVPLRASRSDAPPLEGRTVACVNCHRRSGLGAREGRALIPPITGRYLFHPRGARAQGIELPFAEGARGEREPYTDQTLARAIRSGIDSEGRPLNYLMPRYTLGDAEMAALVGYLKHMDRARTPGVSDTVLHFATIVTPDADPDKRRGVIEVLQKFFADRNAAQRAPPPHLLPSAKAGPSKMMIRMSMQWQLHVWELSGPEDTWREQLRHRLSTEPVFAVISGVGGRNWQPVHDFCESAHLPCLFPNVEAPPADADKDYYSIYFSRGVLLEADLIGQGLLAAPGREGRRVLQVWRAGDVGEAGARQLAALLRAAGVGVDERAIAADAPPEAVAEALRAPGGARAAGELVLWLRGGDLAALGSAGDPPGAVYLSGLMGGLERAPLAPRWREAARMAYPVDLPEMRRARVAFASGWFRLRQVPVIAERAQADTYLACGLLSETLRYMVDNFVPDYLVERAEDTLAHRIMTGYYPRLDLASGQRFASKGGYLVRFAAPDGHGKLLADGDWRLP